MKNETLLEATLDTYEVLKNVALKNLEEYGFKRDVQGLDDKTQKTDDCPQPKSEFDHPNPTH